MSTGEAIAAAVAVAREHGVSVDDPVVLRAQWHVLVHLRPAPLVARVTADVPGGGSGDVARELYVARHAAEGGAPVIQPSDLLDPGPHERDGRTIAYWRFVEERGELDPAAAGRALRAVHDALADYDGDLPPAGRHVDVAAMLDGAEPSADIELLRELAGRPLPAGQALHGDAHLFNCMAGPGGPVWHDFETACRGPREYDLAALVHRERIFGDNPGGVVALEAYGHHDRDALEDAFPAYAAWIAASWLGPGPRSPELRRQLEYLQRYRS
jgi:hypothetical protein